MDFTRRDAMRLGVASAATLMTAGTAAAAEKDLIFADGKRVLFKIKDVTIDGVDEPGRWR
jgi:hypothetical protein